MTEPTAPQPEEVAGAEPAVEPALVEAVARHLLSELAPEETPLFPALSRAYFAQPPAAREQAEGSAGQEALLGFGGAIPASLLTPALLAVSARVLSFVGAQLSQGLQAESGPLVRAALRKVFQRVLPDAEAGAGGKETKAETNAAAEGTTTPLTREQLRAVREVAIAEARRQRLPAAQAERLVAALVATLAVA